MFELKNLTVTLKTENKPLVENISLKVDAGSSLMIIGQSGSGKTMICRAVFGLLDRKIFTVGGEIILEKRDLLNMGSRERRKIYGCEISFIPQNPMTAFDPSLTIGTQLNEIYRVHNEERNCRDAIFNALERAGLNNAETVYKSYPHTLSGGMLQRAVFAAALMNSPKLIIADEPTTALDAEHKLAVIKALLDMRQTGVAVIMITHDFAAAQRFGGEASVMRNGRFVENGDISELLESPKTDYTKELIGAALI